jgi:hypothetical protein
MFQVKHFDTIYSRGKYTFGRRGEVRHGHLDEAQQDDKAAAPR